MPQLEKRRKKPRAKLSNRGAVRMSPITSFPYVRPILSLSGSLKTFHRLIPLRSFKSITSTLARTYNADFKEAHQRILRASTCERLQWCPTRRARTGRYDGGATILTQGTGTPSQGRTGQENRPVLTKRDMHRLHFGSASLMS